MINLLLWRTVIKPLKILTRTAKRISSCSVNQHQHTTLDHPGLEPLTLRRDEPGQLARAFQYMVHVLSQREQDLQQAVRERTQSLEQEMGDRQTAQDALQTYAHAINHDLRNVVMGIASLVQGIRFRNARTGQNATTNDRVQHSDDIAIDATELTMIQKGCDRQLKLMNSLMEVQSSDVWRMVLQPEPFSLRKLTDELHAAYEPNLTAAVTLENQIPRDLPLIRADTNQIQRVFENLIDNALKYNPEGIAITLNASVWGRDRSMIRCTVSDNGIGVDPEKGQGLFKLYARGHEERQPPGQGLGLYICRKIVEAHNGTIGVESSLVGGAQFWFTLPLLGN
ncbi:MAG: HAMP domain-containing sensor histidine kinase [Cyanobacteria bacterium J06626_18]